MWDKVQYACRRLQAGFTCELPVQQLMPLLHLLELLPHGSRDLCLGWRDGSLCCKTSAPMQVQGCPPSPRRAESGLPYIGDMPASCVSN